MRSARWSVPLLIGVLAAAGAPVALGAQGNLSQVVDDWEGRYEVARDNYQAAYQEGEYYENGGILHYVVRQLAA